MRAALIAAVVVALASLSAPARAQSAAPEDVPSAFTYGFQGFLIGAGVGLAGGYLVARNDGFESDDWKPLTYGVGIGALAGGAFGFTLGLIDMGKERKGGGYVVLRDMVLGTGFGATAGAIAGALTVISTKEPEHILLGASIGALAGTVLGAVLGVVEAGRLPSRAAAPRAWTVTLAPAERADGKLAWGPALAARY